MFFHLLFLSADTPYRLMAQPSGERQCGSLPRRASPAATQLGARTVWSPPETECGRPGGSINWPAQRCLLPAHPREAPSPCPAGGLRGCGPGPGGGAYGRSTPLYLEAGGRTAGKVLLISASICTARLFSCDAMASDTLAVCGMVSVTASPIGGRLRSERARNRVMTAVENLHWFVVCH